MKIIKSMNLSIASLFICIGILVIEVFSQTYNEYFGKDMHEFSYSELKVENETKIVLSCKERTEICFLDSNYHCLKWVYKNKSNGGDFAAVRILNAISITGKKDGSEFNCSIKIGNQPWLQFWEFGIAKMISSGKNEMAFSSIDPNKPSKAATFLVAKKGLTRTKTGGRDEEANHVTITIKGLPAMIFTAKMWLRKSDNVFLKSEMPQGPFVPITRVEIQD